MLKDKLVILGCSSIAEVAYEYFTHSPHEVVAFCVDREYIIKPSLFGLPIVPYDEVQNIYSPADHSFYAAANYSAGNALRKRWFAEMKAKGYTPASYVSNHAFVWHNVPIGEHCFIFEDNTLQPFVKIGNNIVLWSGNHIGHHSTIHDHTFVSSHVVISGVCEIGESCFLGVNATIANNVKMGNNCVIGAGALVLGDVPDNTTVVGMWKRQK